MIDFFKKDPDKLLKEATRQKKADNIHNAIELLKEANEKISKGSVIYSVETFLRLPLYLQAASRNDEAWEEFNHLLTEGYPNQMKNRELIPMDHSIIYDKMRLFFERDGKWGPAIKFGIYSYISWAIGLYYQNRKDELQEYTSEETLDSELNKFLKISKQINHLNVFRDIIKEQIKKIPNIDYIDLGDKIDELNSRK